MGSPVPPALEAVEEESVSSDPKPGDKGYIGGLPPTEVRRIRAKARRFTENVEEFKKDALHRMIEHALKLDAMCRYATEANAASAAAASYRRAVSDIIAAVTPPAAKK